ncbi:hypothetical protein GOODEAATRI_000582 [Goodea atripinnis]|uniref:ATP synthase F(1) complex subunit delta, mitochondrial n=1 Tax=Goodea atripinnis TaxID=208336 RepID=A0ABV0MXU6_9TELE
MSFTFASPTQVFFKEASVKQVDVPTLTGAFGILPAHVPTLQVLRPGVVTVFNDDGSSAKYFDLPGCPGSPRDPELPGGPGGPGGPGVLLRNSEGIWLSSTSTLLIWPAKKQKRFR